MSWRASGIVVWAQLWLGCGYSEAAMQVERDRVAALEAELGAAQAASAQAQQRNAALEAESQHLRERTEELQAEQRRLRQRCERLENALEELRQLEAEEPIPEDAR